MREEESIGMVTPEIGAQEAIGPANCEIIAVGPQFREVDFRSLEKLLRKSPFFKKVPM